MVLHFCGQGKYVLHAGWSKISQLKSTSAIYKQVNSWELIPLYYYETKISISFGGHEFQQQRVNGASHADSCAENTMSAWQSWTRGMLQRSHSKWLPEYLYIYPKKRSARDGAEF